jgi:phytoene dehydrogenase-like protein
MQEPRKIVIIGGGIAGLCAAVYARKCGYQATVFEMHESAGGLATSWRRGAYTFETCLHWLLGSNPNSAMYARWREVFDIDRLTWVQPEEYARIETEQGERLSIYTNADRLEAELLQQAPQDSAEIQRLASSVRGLANFEIPDTTDPGLPHWLALLRAVPALPRLRWWSNLSINEYGRRFKHPILREFFCGGPSSELSALAFVLSLAWMSHQNASYPIGGSQAIVRPIVDRLLELGGRLRLGTQVKKILVENGIASGIQLTHGETIPADWVISAADGHATIFDLLDGRYRDSSTDKLYDSMQTFPSYVQVSLGISRDLSQQAGFTLRLLDAPLTVDPATQLSQISLRFFHFDPTFAPPGKTAVTCFLPTSNFRYWCDLQRAKPERYQEEKHRVAAAVIDVLERSVPGVRQAIETIDVSTPATVIRYTGNWKGSMEGWLLMPGAKFNPLPMTLPDLRRFLMVGQWVMPGGGLPSGLMTARSAMQSICKQDGVPFALRMEFELGSRVPRPKLDSA